SEIKQPVAGSIPTTGWINAFLTSVLYTGVSPYIPKGFYLIQEETAYEILKGSIIINIKDLINSNRHSDRSRLNGCCGLDGCDGMNGVCLHNHEIGTEFSDCWTLHCVILNPELVRVI
ncbi:hypothetical protein, partial [Solibacillus cecembensis]|uniref:hypothetical protein n=1 Tax=Solibacillus cecembensis TaxID=459347 RepID=UPI003CFFA79B